MERGMTVTLVASEVAVLVLLQVMVLVLGATTVKVGDVNLVTRRRLILKSRTLLYAIPLAERKRTR